MDGKIIGSAGAGGAVDFPVRIEIQTRWKISRIIQRPIERAAASRTLEKLVVVRTHLPVRQTGREDLNAIARLNDEVGRAVVVVNGDVLAARILIIPAANDVVQAVIVGTTTIINIHVIIAIGVGVHLRLVVVAIDVRIGINLDTTDGIAVILDMTGDVQVYAYANIN